MCSSLLSSFGCLSLRTALPETTLYNNTAALFDRAGVVISVYPRMPVLWLQRAPRAFSYAVSAKLLDRVVEEGVTCWAW